MHPWVTQKEGRIPLTYNEVVKLHLVEKQMKTAFQTAILIEFLRLKNKKKPKKIKLQSGLHLSSCTFLPRRPVNSQLPLIPRAILWSGFGGFDKKIEEKPKEEPNTKEKNNKDEEEDVCFTQMVRRHLAKQNRLSMCETSRFNPNGSMSNRNQVFSPEKNGSSTTKNKVSFRKTISIKSLGWKDSFKFFEPKTTRNLQLPPLKYCDTPKGTETQKTQGPLKSPIRSTRNLSRSMFKIQVN